MTQSTSQNISSLLEKHPYVDRVLVLRDETANAVVSGTPAIVYLVPNAAEVPHIARAMSLREAASSCGLSLEEPRDDMAVVQINRRETEFLIREIFENDTYFQHGISLREGACVVDVGANIGMFALRCAKAQPLCTVWAIEPLKELCRAIELNALLHDAQIRVINCAIGANDGTTTFTYYVNNTVMSSRYGDAAADEALVRNYLAAEGISGADRSLDRLLQDRMRKEVRVVAQKSLQRLLDDCGIDTIDLLKVDVEKSEYEILESLEAPAWDRVKQLVVEADVASGTFPALKRLIEARGFSVIVDRDAQLATTNFVNLYCSRGRQSPNEARPVAPSEAPRTQRALIKSLRAYLQSELGGSLPELVFSVVAELPVQPATGPTSQSLAADLPELQGEELRTDTERKLADIWRTILGTSQITRVTDFFDIGGNSLTAVAMMVQLEMAFREEILSPEVLFQSGRLWQVAAAIDRALSVHEGR